MLHDIWEPPVFYSLFLFPLHLTLTTWPVIAVQALLTVRVLHLVLRTLLPDISVWWLLPLTGAMALISSLPWFASQLVPDVFTGLLVPTLALLTLTPERLSMRERAWLVVFGSFMIAVHQSHVPLAIALLLLLVPLRRRFDLAAQRLTLPLSVAPLALALVALVSVNLLTFNRASLSPFGNVFLLTRIICDGPGMDVLRRDCPAASWRLCAFIDSMPATADDFLWRQDGPVVRAGGAKAVSTEAGAIISSALLAEPGTELLALVRNAAEQLMRFSTGDGLESWPATVMPQIQRHFPPSEHAAFATSRQNDGTLRISAWLQTLHRVAALAGIAGCGVIVLAASRHAVAGFAAAALLAALANAVITGGLSGPHDRYQSRIMWLPLLITLIGAASWVLNATRRYRSGAWRAYDPRTSHATNVFWSGLEAATSALLSFVSVFIVARLIGPSEVGVGAAAVAVHVLLWVAVNALFADPLVQRRVLDDATFSSAFVASVAVGCGAGFLQAGAGPLLAWTLNDGRLVSMAVALALPLPLVGAAGPVQGLLTRNRAYRKLAWRTLVGQGGGTAAGIACAMLGSGAWALVVQQLVISGVGAATLLLRCPMQPRRIINWQSLREMLRIGLPLTASTLVHHGRYRLFALLIGGTSGAAALGQVHMAFRLVDAVRELAFTAQWRLMLPLLSERQTDLRALRIGIDRCLAWSSLLAFPLCSAMAVAIQPLVAMLLGPVWQPAGDAALPLIALTAWLFLSFPIGVAVIARGEAGYALIANVAGTAATLAGVLLVKPDDPLDAVLVWLGAQLFVSPYVLWTSAHVLGTSPLRPLRAGMPMLAASLLATAVAIVLPEAIGEPASPQRLLGFRLALVAAALLPVAALAVAPSRLLLRRRLSL